MQGEKRAPIKSPGQIIQEINAEVEKKPSRSDYDLLRITKERDIPQPKPTITIGGCAIASAANITGISAAAKAGKTALTGAILAGAISKTGEIDAFDDLSVLPNTESKAVIHFDTEQSEADQQHHVNTILKRAGFENTPDCFRSYNIRQLTLENYQPITNTLCELSAKEFKGVHLIVIDGGADYLASVNDEAQATQIVHYFTRLSIQYNCPVIIIIHLNPGSDKERGHFGSEVQRKCYGLLTITKEGEISTVQPKIMRKSGNDEIPLIHFTFSKEKGYHVQIDAPDKEKQKLDMNRQRHAEVSKAVFGAQKSLSYTQAVSAIMQHTSKGERTAKSMITNMAGWGQIVKGDDNNYRIVQNSAK